MKLTSWNRMIAAVAVASAPASAMAAPQSYNFTLAPPTNYTTQEWPRFVTSADFNGDGYLDLVTTNEFSRSVSIFLNQQDGTFAAPTSFAVDTGGALMSMAVGDVNRDGILDLVVGGYYGTDKVTVLLGLGLDPGGQPQFSAGSQYVVGQEPVYISLADFNGDGYLDILSPNEVDGTVAIIENQQDGTFDPPEQHSVGAQYWAGSGDLNNDGLTDIAVMTSAAQIAILYNTGSDVGPRFAYAKTIANGSHESAIGDINGDGIADIVTANKGSSTISVFTNDGTGNFSEVAYNSGPNPGWVEIVDLNKDGANDLITCNQGEASYDVFINNGNGTFSSNLTYYIPSMSYQASAADLNNDGAIDIITSNAPSNTLSVFLQKINITTPGSDVTTLPDDSSAVTLEGDDQVTGNEGAEVIDTGPGFDTVIPDPTPSTSGNRNDKINGGSDYDTVVYKGVKARYTITKNSNGTWTVRDTTLVDGTDVLRGVEYVKFSDQTVQLASLPHTQEGTPQNDTLNGTAYNDYSFGRAGNDSISSAGGNDYASGGDGSDTINAGDGNDTMDGGPGADNLSGGAGNDVMKSSAGVDTFNGGAGIDTADYAKVAQSVAVVLNGASVATVRIASIADDRLSNVENVIGGPAADSLAGDALRNRLTGGPGHDTLSGNGGADVLLGNAGSDRLSGGDGNDVIIPGTGTDTMSGGAGADVFKFMTLADSPGPTIRDIITDFTPGTDKIDLSVIDANSLVGGRQSFTFVNAAAFSGVAGELRFAGGILSGDVNGDKTADLQIDVRGVAGLSRSDFR